MSRKQTLNGGEGKGSSKIPETSEGQDRVRRATKHGRNHKTKGTVAVEQFTGTRLDAVGAIAARRKAAYDEARKVEWRQARDQAILRDRKNEYARKGQFLITLRAQMDQAEDDHDRLKTNLRTAPENRKGEIKAAMRKIEGKLRGMQVKAVSLEARTNELDGLIFGTKVSA